MAIGLSFRKASRELSGRSKWWGAPDLPAGSPYPVLPLDEEDDCEDLTGLDSEGLRQFVPRNFRIRVSALGPRSSTIPLSGT